MGGTSGPACRDALLVLGGRHAQILVPLGRRVRGTGALRRRSPLAPQLPADLVGGRDGCPPLVLLVLALQFAQNFARPLA